MGREYPGQMESKQDYPPRSPLLLQRGLCYKAAFLGGNAAVFSIIYSVPGILNVGPDETRDTTAETFLWLTSVRRRICTGTSN